MSETTKSAGLPPASYTPFENLLDQVAEVKCARVTHPVSAFHEHSRLSQVVLGPVHAR
jgi:hypothetical protein